MSIDDQRTIFFGNGRSGSRRLRKEWSMPRTIHCRRRGTMTTDIHTSRLGSTCTIKALSIHEGHDIWGRIRVRVVGLKLKKHEIQHTWVMVCVFYPPFVYDYLRCGRPLDNWKCSLTKDDEVIRWIICFLRWHLTSKQEAVPSVSISCFYVCLEDGTHERSFLRASKPWTTASTKIFSCNSCWLVVRSNART